MTSSQLFAEANRWQKRLGLSHWEVEVDVTPLPTSNIVGRVLELRYEYRQARIVFDLAKANSLCDDARIRAVVAHEYCHLVLAPMDLFLAVARAAFDGATCRSLMRLSDLACEVATTELERAVVSGVFVRKTLPKRLVRHYRQLFVAATRAAQARHNRALVAVLRSVWRWSAALTVRAIEKALLRAERKG